jgi:Type II CAAX prenyl endopeptidase Rce1-like
MRSVTTRLFWILWLAGMAGVLSFLLVDISALVANLPAAAGTELPFSPMVIKLIGLIQPTILLALAVFTGVRLAPAVGLSAPVAEALAGGKNWAPLIKPQILPGVITGVVGAVVLLASWILVRPIMPPLFVTRAEAFNTTVPLVTRVLYGGITEELLLRWGLLTFLVWVAWRLFQKGRGKPGRIYFVGAIVISSIVFGVGHLPIVPALGVDFTFSIVAFVILGNAMFGVIAGFLYWLRGLEAAIIAHMAAHLVLVSAIHLAS